jgi:phosphatidylserine/phosphatidylglycerophosphate/cardiolipin synthase-like enzyme
LLLTAGTCCSPVNDTCMSAAVAKPEYLLSAIGSAETSVHLTNAHFVPDPQMLAALEAVAGRRVDVTLILPSQTDSWLVFHAGRGYYDRLLRAGVKIYERRGVILHSKTALIDGVWATVGSTNLDWRSFLHNHELNAVVLGVDGSPARRWVRFPRARGGWAKVTADPALSTALHPGAATEPE